MSPRLPLRLPMAVCGCLLAATACGPASTLDVTMRGVSITVPRIVSTAVQLVPPPSMPVAAQLPLPPLPAPEPLPTTAPIAAPPAPDPCPRADQLAIPGELAVPNVAHPPAADSVDQHSTGSFAGASTAPASGKLSGSVRAVLTLLAPATSATGQKVDNWRVERTSLGPFGGNSVEQYQLVEPSSAPAAATTALYLTGLAWKDRQRGDVAFAPMGSGVELMPIPVGDTGAFGTVGYQPPVEWASSQTDPLSQTTLSVQGNVTGKKRVDVCGTVVDTYTVALTGTLTTPTQVRNLAWRLQVATQFGAAIIEDELTLSDAGSGFRWDRTLTDTAVPPSGAQHGR